MSDPKATASAHTPSQTPNGRLLTAFDGGLPDAMPVAPLYMGLYLASRRHAARAQEWRARVDAAGGELPVSAADELAVEREVWLDSYRAFAEPPDWLDAPVLGGLRASDGAWIEARGGGLYWRRGHREWQLDALFSSMEAPLWEAYDPPQSVAEVERRIPLLDRAALEAGDHFRLTRVLQQEVGQSHALYWAAGAPYPAAYEHLGFHGLMVALRERPEVVIAIAERTLVNRLTWAAVARNAGLAVVFVEEWACSGDLISPADYLACAWPFERDLCRGLRDLGFRVVLYFCGPLEDRLPELLRLEADAFAFEESKKGWAVDVGAIRRVAGPDRCLFGNTDVTLLRDGDHARLEREVRRQVTEAGPRAFVVSTGSPLTLDTPAAEVDALVLAARRCCRS